MANLNRCDFIGRITKTPESRYTTGGTCVTSCTIAINEKFKDKSGEWQEKTEYINLVYWGKLAEIAKEYFDKGQEIYTSGKLQTRKWQDKDGNDRYTTEIVAERIQFLSPKEDKYDPPFQNGDVPF